MQHTDQCKRLQNEIIKSRNEFDSAWPRHCKPCDAWGGTESSQNHPFGSTTASEDMFESCPVCIANGICPRCGHQHNEEWNTNTELESCMVCNWNWGKNEGDTPRSEFSGCECFCEDKVNNS